ncbi:hypothetical protein M9H77_11871 [Catharanthus roseus]|uniref:Uncharacterized protein n=1 Tax=Catharanthus roseus TaxID=4058 RepID=A0ACC0BFV8_CATRO|nr:hypothetical protein M9H77_11871 [Catharanthus roseus]
MCFIVFSFCSGSQTEDNMGLSVPSRSKTLKESKNGTKTELLSWIQELKTLIQDFDLQLGDSRNDLRRRSELQLQLQEFNPKLSFTFLIRSFTRLLFGIEKGRII